MPESPPDDPPLRGWILLRRWFLGLALLSGLLVVVSHLGEIEHFLELARQLRPVWIIPALLLQLSTYVCVAAVWHGALRAGGARVPFGPLVPLGLAKLFSDQAMPSAGVSGTAIFVAALRRRGVPTDLCMGAMLLSLVAFYAAYVACAVAGIVVLAVFHELHPWILVAATVFFLLALGIPSAVFLLRRWSAIELPPWLLRIPGAGGLAEAFAGSSTDLLGRPLLLTRSVILHAGVFALDAATLWVLLLAIGQPVSYAVAFPSFVLASMVATVGLVPLGLGTFEATCVALLGVLGVRVEPALTATLLLRGFTMWLPMIPGMWLARRALRPAPAAARPTQTPGSNQTA